MAEYIEREEVLAEYDRQHQGPPGGARKIIAEWPAADVAPVRHGKWRPCKSWNPDYEGFECSECGARFQGIHRDNYCGNCGALMEADHD